MSLIITIHTREGIVMASDSRLTLNAEQNTPEGKKVLLAAGMSDSNYKTFLAQDRIGVSTFGQAEIKGVPIGGYIESFIREHLKEKHTVTDFAKDLNSYFKAINPTPKCGFHIAGYEENKQGLKQVVYRISPGKDSVKLTNPENQNGEPTQGASWDGEGDILARLLTPVYTKEANGNYKQLPQYQVPWQFFTLQDAIDFAVYAIRTTIDSVRFLPRPKTVGGPIDVLVIKPTEAVWISKKELTRK